MYAGAGWTEARLIRRAQRLEEEEQRLARENVLLPPLVRAPFGRLRTERLQRLTVRPVKFAHWLRVQLFLQPHHEPAIAALRRLYAVL